LKKHLEAISSFEKTLVYYERELMREGKRNLNGQYRIPQ
jgi:hypothetical protein